MPSRERGRSTYLALGALSFLRSGLEALNISDSTWDRLNKAARTLAPVPKLALEIRLNQKSKTESLTLDLHQLFLLDSRDAEILTDFCARSPEVMPYPVCTGERVAHWLAVAGSRRGPDHLYFEWDFAALGGEPSVFLPLDVGHGQGLDEGAREERLRELSKLTGSAVANAAGSAWAAGQDSVSVSHVGAMTSRGDILRVNYRGVRAGGLVPLLQRVQWPGDAARVDAVFGQLLELADKITVAVTFSGEHAVEGLGFEVLFEESLRFEPRWKRLFALLREWKCCREEEARCLLAVERQFFPYEQGVTWPASWMLATEENGGTSIPRVDRTLSHVKVSVNADGALFAKAYVSARMEWEEAAAMQAPQPLSARSESECIEAAVRFLLYRRLQNGWWTEFHTLLGPSDEWTTAFVGLVLSHCSREEAQRAAEDAAERLLSRQRPDGGWGYNADCPADADTTAWVLKLFARLQRQDAANERGLSFLQQHLSAQGAVMTYQASSPIAFATGNPLAAAAGWKAGHLCVSANAAGLLGASALDSLAESQSDVGYWRPYWWKTPALATGLACELLGNDPKYRERVLRAADWAEHFEYGARSAFVESWLIRVLLCGTDEQRRLANQRAAALGTWQSADGSWDNSADLKIPEAHDASGDTAPDLLYERRHVFSTAAALACLLRNAEAREAGCPQ